MFVQYDETTLAFVLHLEEAEGRDFLTRLPSSITAGDWEFPLRKRLHVSILPMHIGQVYEMWRQAHSAEHTAITRLLQEFSWQVEFPAAPIPVRYIKKPDGFDVAQGYAIVPVRVAHPAWKPEITEESLVVLVHIPGIAELYEKLREILGAEFMAELQKLGLEFDPNCLHVTIASHFGGIPLSTRKMVDELTCKIIEINR